MRPLARRPTLPRRSQRAEPRGRAGSERPPPARGGRENPLVRVTLIFLTGAVGISFAAIFIRLALPAPPVVTGFYRMFFASVLVGVWFLARRHSLRIDRRAAAFVLASGLCLGTDLALWNTSVVRTSVATATLLVNTTPVYVGLYSLLVLREPLHRRFAVGTALALAGTVLLVGVPADRFGELEGALLALAAALFYAAYLLLMRAARQGVDAAPALLLMSLSATAALGFYGLVGDDAFRGFPASSWAAMVGAAVIGQIVGVLGIIWALRFLPATLASVALLAQPVGTAVLGWILLGEAIGLLQGAGGVAILVGILLAAQSSRVVYPTSEGS